MASQTSGYQGFKSFSVQTCPTLKPGETYTGRASKFSKMGSAIITPAQHNRLGRHGFESIAAQATLAVQPGDYHVPDKRGVSANELAPSPRKFLATSTYLHDFTAAEAEARVVLDADMGALEAAFGAVARNNAVDLANVPTVLRRALGAGVPPRLLALFESVFDHAQVPSSPFRDGITWDAFQAAVTYVQTQLVRELGSVGVGGGGGQSSYAKAEAPKVIPATTPASSYQLDFGRYGDEPLARPYVRRRGMASTTDDLQHGTAKDTFHVPGYMGFLPRTAHNPDAVAHAEGAVLRGRKDELRLYHSDNLPGYTGHKPVDCANYRGECRAGSHELTTTGTAYRPHLGPTADSAAK